MADSGNTLTKRQKKFCDIYLSTNDRNKAVAEAGYSVKNVDVCSSQLFANPKIKNYLEFRARTLVTENIDEITAIVKGLSKKDAYALEVYKSYQAIQDPKNASKFKYLELLGKIYGLLESSPQQNYIFNVDNRVLNHTEIVSGAQKIMTKLHNLTKHKSVHNHAIDVTPIEP
jgi:hypothetical protein